MKLSLPIPFGLLLALAPATLSLAQTDASEPAFYRVEAIVFTHAGNRPDGWPVTDTADHYGARDPAWRSFARQAELARAESATDTPASDAEVALNMIDTLASLESGEEPLTEALIYPEPWLALDELSGPMARARDRLERSGAYRVRDWLAWHQPIEQRGRSPRVRLHDDRLVALDWVSLAPTGRLLRDGRTAQSARDLAPAFHYRLDGSIRLRQRQFMHADVDLDWRVPETIGPSPWPLPPLDAALEVHELDQSRTIRPGRFEYFDSAWLGLLLRVTPVEIAPPEADADSDEQGAP